VRVERVDVFVIGGGGTGSDVTAALAGAGMNVAMAEREALGGECANFGCDPSKAMLKAARVAALARRAGEFGIRVGRVEVDFPAVMRRVRALIDEETREGASVYERLGARVLMQEARLTGPHRVETSDGTVWEADRVVLATGSAPSAPPIEGLERGGYWTNRQAIWHGEAVPTSLAILGAGAIGVEFAQIYARFGAKVTVVEALDRVLPLEDADSSAAIEMALGEEGIEFLTGARVEAAERTADGGWRLSMAGGPAVSAERLLVATGRRPVFDGHDLAAAGVELDERGRPVLTETLRTTTPHIWAGGDATGDQLFTHVGGYEAEVIVAEVLGHPFPADYRVVPRVTFCEPEVASVGLTEEQARKAGGEVRVGRVPFADGTRSFLEAESAWHVKVLADAGSGEVLGGHIVGEAAGELLGEILVAMAGRVPASVAGRAIHPYPTRSETVRAAFREAGGGD
jgi:pyruvate/2-oxoglutarate dehydrogenase complex dihydrolipoamide dehydrogenase (E3) component